MPKLTSIKDLSPQTRLYRMINPETGEEWEAELRELMPEQIAEINARVKKPKPKETGQFKKDPITGRVEPIFDEDAPEYRKELEVSNYEYVRMWLLESLVGVEIPGDTPDARLESIRNYVPFWALTELRKAMEEVNGLRYSDIAFAKKKSQMTPYNS